VRRIREPWRKKLSRGYRIALENGQWLRETYRILTLDDGRQVVTPFIHYDEYS
jgi:hypothetical protein